MTQVRYQIALALSHDDYIKLMALREKGVKVIEIFRAGLDTKEKKTK